ncbi:MAG: sialidase family protein [Rhodothermales bacterium]|nr:sialidase family protein [Rhodothermales bacterium]
MRPLHCLLFLAALVLAGCGRSEANRPGAAAPAPAGAGGLVFTAVDAPAAPGSGMPNLTSTGDGGVLMSWIAPGTDTAWALRFARLDGTAWSEPRTIATGDDWFVNWADFPSIVALGEGRLAAHYLEKSSDASPYAYDVRIVQSRDGGATWSAPRTPHRDGTPTEHGFVSLMPGPDGHLRAVWLDGRRTGGGHDGHGGGAMTLRTATIGPDGALADEAELDARICDCCQSGGARTASGFLVAYRDRSDTAPEIRDIATVRHDGTGWSAPARVHADGWELEGCPVNGPVVAADGARAAVAWFTAAGDTPRVRIAFSEDEGATFAAPIEVDDGAPIGRVDAVLLPGGDALVSWVERTDDGAAIRIRRVAPDGRRAPSQTVAPTSPARASGFPQLARQGDRLVLAWTEAADPARLHTAVAAL